MQEEYHLLFGIDIIASVRRLGLITFRLAMILSALRLGIPHPSAERYIKNWCRLGLLNRIKHGYYEKTQS